MPRIQAIRSTPPFTVYPGCGTGCGSRKSAGQGYNPIQTLSVSLVALQVRLDEMQGVRLALLVYALFTQVGGAACLSLAIAVLSALLHAALLQGSCRPAIATYGSLCLMTSCC